MTRRDDERVVQFMVSPDISKAIKALALERDQTVRSLILCALRDAGLEIDEAELADRRRGGVR